MMLGMSDCLLLVVGMWLIAAVSCGAVAAAAARERKQLAEVRSKTAQLESRFLDLELFVRERLMTAMEQTGAAVATLADAGAETKQQLAAIGAAVGRVEARLSAWEI